MPEGYQQSVDTTIKPEKYLNYRIDKVNNIIYFDQLSNDGVATGKSLIQLLENTDLDLSSYSKVVFNIDKGGMQFLSFYTTLPPGSPFAKGLHPILDSKQKNIDINILSQEAAQDLLFTLATTDRDKITTMWQLMNGYETVKINISEDLKSHLLELISIARESGGLFKIDSRGLYARYSEHLMRDDFSRTLDRLEEFILENVQTDNTLQAPTSSEVTEISQRSNPISSEQAQAILDGEVLYTTSDERTDIFYRSNKLFLVDCGSPATLKNIETIAAAARSRATRMNELVINISHFHDDHIGALTEVLENFDRLKTMGFTKIRLNIPPSLTKQFTGYYLKNIELIDNLITKRGFKMNFLERQKDYMSVAPTFPGNLTHYILTESFMYKDNDDMLVFLSDWNAPTTGDFMQVVSSGSINQYFKELFHNLHRRHIQTCSLFLDLDSGHLKGSNNFYEEHQMTYEEYLLQTINKMAERYGIELTIYNEHAKNNYDYYSALTSETP